MTSTWFPNGFFDVEMIEADGRHTAKIYLRGMDDTRALLAEETFQSNEVAFQNAVEKAMDQLAVLGRKVQEARSAKPPST